ncbi:hypothetical protein MD26_14125 [Pseudomonas sp. H2]|nr:hypothetical protein PC358_04970 [Pseudomonas capeferrum]KGI92579.1 hypothetical protein MD26_14125 [Pseudomonas sp. H2]
MPGFGVVQPFKTNDKTARLTMQLIIDDVKLWTRHRRGLLFSMDDSLIDRGSARKFKIFADLRYQWPRMALRRV